MAISGEFHRRILHVVKEIQDHEDESSIEEASTARLQATTSSGKLGASVYV